MYLTALSMHASVAHAVAAAIKASLAPVAELLFVGHSLGGSIAVIMSAFFSEDRSWAAGAAPRIVAHAHACPAFASVDFPFPADVVATAYNRDVVPVLSVGQLLVAGEALSKTIGISSKPAVERLRARDRQPTHLIPTLEEYYASLSVLSPPTLRPTPNLIFLHPLTPTQAAGRGLDPDAGMVVALRPNYEELALVIRPTSGALDHHPRRYSIALASAARLAIRDHT
jgi:hypothetical protein